VSANGVQQCRELNREVGRNWAGGLAQTKTKTTRIKYDSFNKISNLNASHNLKDSLILACISSVL
jgi:hypothetical protein